MGDNSILDRELKKALKSGLKVIDLGFITNGKQDIFLASYGFDLPQISNGTVLFGGQCIVKDEEDTSKLLTTSDIVIATYLARLGNLFDKRILVNLRQEPCGL